MCRLWPDSWDVRVVQSDQFVRVGVHPRSGKALDERAARFPCRLVAGVDLGELVKLVAVDLDDEVRFGPAEVRSRAAELDIDVRDRDASVPEDFERAGLGISTAAVVRELRVAIAEGSQGGSTSL